jgi:hypothetical protein
MSVVPAAILTPGLFTPMRRTDLLGTPGEEGFDRLDGPVCRFPDAPVALISRVDEPRSRPPRSTVAPP